MNPYCPVIKTFLKYVGIRTCELPKPEKKEHRNERHEVLNAQNIYVAPHEPLAQRVVKGNW